jgi:hypothetical protein
MRVWGKLNKKSARAGQKKFLFQDQEERKGCTKRGGR